MTAGPCFHLCLKKPKLVAILALVVMAVVVVLVMLVADVVIALLVVVHNSDPFLSRVGDK